MASARSTEGLAHELEVNFIFTSLFHIIENGTTYSGNTTHLLFMYHIIPSCNMFRPWGPSGITIKVLR